MKKEFKGCTLTHLWYDHEVSNDSEDKWEQQYDGKDAIVLLSNFNVNGSGGDGSFNPNETYKNWQWILFKNSDGQWVLKNWGY